MDVLVDTSVWIDYFRGGGNSDELDYLIDENLLVTNDLILAELIPFMKVKNHRKLINLLESIRKFRLNIIWEQIIGYQYQCLRKGINGIGIPDLIIAQNAIQNNCKIFSLDSHFGKMKEAFKLDILNR